MVRRSEALQIGTYFAPNVDAALGAGGDETLRLIAKYHRGHVSCVHLLPTQLFTRHVIHSHYLAVLKPNKDTALTRHVKAHGAHIAASVHKVRVLAEVEARAHVPNVHGVTDPAEKVRRRCVVRGGGNGDELAHSFERVHTI